MILHKLTLGEMGMGKSSFCSKMSGIKLMHEDFEDDIPYSKKKGEAIRVDKNNRKDLFNVGGTHESVTKVTYFALTHLFGNKSRQRVMIIDSPGFFDPEESASEEIRKNLNLKEEDRKVADMTRKLEALGSVDSILLLMNLQGGRIPETLVTAMKALEKMFQESNGQFIFNLALIWSKCDENKLRDYRRKMKNKDKEYLTLISEFQKFGIQVSKSENSQLYFITSFDESLDTIGRQDEFERLFKFFDSLKPIKTENIQDPTAFMQGDFNFLFFLQISRLIVE